MVLYFRPSFACFTGRAGVVLVRKGWKYDAITAEKLLKDDTRPPVVYVRSFKDDAQIILAPGLRRWFSMAVAWTVAVSVEQELAAIMNRLGPLVAIGKPGSHCPSGRGATLCQR